MRVLRVFLIFALAVCHAAAHACIWEYATKTDGKSVVVNGLGRMAPMRISYPAGHWEEKLKENESKCVATAEPAACNDRAVALIHLGRAKEAITQLEALEKEKPGSYQTAANLGTAFELSGQDEQALKWIREGIRRNPNSHAGTEWLHVRILEAKLALARDREWLRTHSPIDGQAHGPTGNDPAPVWRAEGVMDHAGRSLKLDEVQQAISYQLQERLQFVKPPEPIVGELFLELASLVALKATVEDALSVLKNSADFSPVRVELLAQRRQHFQDLVARNPNSGKHADPSGGSGSATTTMTIVVGVLLLFSVALAWWLWRRRSARGSAS